MQTVTVCPEGIPEHLWQGMMRYVQHGIRPGSFLEAVFAGDLHEVFRRGDVQSLDGLRATVNYVLNYCPVLCYGSQKRVQEWVEIGGLEGLNRVVH